MTNTHRTSARGTEVFMVIAFQTPNCSKPTINCGHRGEDGIPDEAKAVILTAENEYLWSSNEYTLLRKVRRLLDQAEFPTDSSGPKVQKRSVLDLLESPAVNSSPSDDISVALVTHSTVKADG